MDLQYKDKTKTFEERKALYKKEVIDRRSNPIPVNDFNPETFDLMADDTDEYKFAKRQRILPPKILPTNGMNPKELLEGQTIGMYESKQDLYLIFAHKCNEMQIEIDKLKEEISKLK